MSERQLVWCLFCLFTYFIDSLHILKSKVILKVNHMCKTDSSRSSAVSECLISRRIAAQNTNHYLQKLLVHVEADGLIVSTITDNKSLYDKQKLYHHHKNAQCVSSFQHWYLQRKSNGVVSAKASVICQTSASTFTFTIHQVNETLKLVIFHIIPDGQSLV